MTIFYPDVSNIGDAGLRIQPNTVIVVAKASEGTTFTDGSYRDFQAQAANVGAFFVAYHWLWADNIDEQARHAFSIVGAKVPLMLDIEQKGSVPTVDQILQFCRTYRALGGTVSLAYLPRWYWAADMGAPDLSPLTTAGLNLVSSNYTTYSDTGPGWTPYGGVMPYAWQYTDAFTYGGRPVDFNAVRDTLDGFKQRVGVKLAVPTPPPPVPHPAGHKVGSRVLQLESPRLVGDDVLFVQRFIGPAKCGSADGVYGPHTASGVEWYQGMRGIRVDGIVGPQTWSNMGVRWVGHDY